MALSRSTLTDAALLFVLEELDSGADAYLGPHAAGVAADLVALRGLRAGGLSKRLSGELDKAIEAIQSGGVDQPAGADRILLQRA